VGQILKNLRRRFDSADFSNVMKRTRPHLKLMLGAFGDKNGEGASTGGESLWIISSYLSER